MQSMPFSEHDLAQLRHLLPPTFDQLLTVAGAEAAFALVRHYSGTHIPIGKNQIKAGKVLHAMLAEVVGEHIAEKIEHAYATQRKIYIPKLDGVVLELRNRLIRQQFDELTQTMTATLAVNNLVAEHKLCDRHIWAILKQSDRLPESLNHSPKNQISLF